MIAETVVRNEISRYGWRWVEVMRMGSPVDMDVWTAEVPAAALHLLRTTCRVEKGLDIHRLYMWWPARELIKMRVEGRTIQRVMWYVEPGQTVRNAIYNAAATWWLERDGWPQAAWVWALPKEAPGVLAIECGGDASLSLREAVIPRNFVMVGNE